MTAIKAGDVVAITGSTGGIGRASAIEFGRLGAKVALAARGDAGLAGAAAEVREAGAQEVITVPTDTADNDQVVAAVHAIEEQLGPIDVWVNVAFTSVFAPFDQISPDEFKRVTEVNYLGYVYATMAVLPLMKKRGRGTIVQVGSALAHRCIPLQSAYCGSKHAIFGFHQSLRTELLHDSSPIHVTMVQMPAVNTPQFSWVLSRLPDQAQPVPPIYQPEVAARAVRFAAEHPERSEYWVGGSTVGTLLAERIAPGILDRYLAHTGYKSQQTGTPRDPEQPANLWEPADADHDFGTHGVFDDRATAHSPQVWLSQHRTAVSAVAGIVGLGLAAALAKALS